MQKKLNPALMLQIATKLAYYNGQLWADSLK